MYTAQLSGSLTITGKLSGIGGDPGLAIRPIPRWSAAAWRWFPGKRSISACATPIPFLGDLTVQQQYWGKQYEDSDNHDIQGNYWVTNLTLSKTFKELSGRWLNGTTVYMKIQNMMNRTYIIDLGGGIPKVGTPLLIQFGVTVPINY